MNVVNNISSLCQTLSLVRGGRRFESSHSDHFASHRRKASLGPRLRSGNCLMQKWGRVRWRAQSSVLQKAELPEQIGVLRQREWASCSGADKSWRCAAAAGRRGLLPVA
jgi:hypothetical protein